MDMSERVFYSAVGTFCLFVFVLFASIWYDAQLPERMARDGYQAYRLPGDNTVYWTKPAEEACAKVSF